MAKQQFTIEKIGDLDNGRIAAAVNLGIKNAVRDCCDRPGETGKRKVTLTMTLEPLSGDEGVCDATAVEFEIKTSLPPRRSKCFEMATDVKGTLVFNPASEDSIRQGTLDETV